MVWRPEGYQPQAAEEEDGKLPEGEPSERAAFQVPESSQDENEDISTQELLETLETYIPQRDLHIQTEIEPSIWTIIGSSSGSSELDSAPSSSGQSDASVCLIDHQDAPLRW